MDWRNLNWEWLAAVCGALAVIGALLSLVDPLTTAVVRRRWGKFSAAVGWATWMGIVTPGILGCLAVSGYAVYRIGHTADGLWLGW